jgi:hypothetical protein
MGNTESDNLPDSICENCPAAYALGVYAANPEQAASEEMSASRLAMTKNEAVAAKEALNKAAGKIACHKFEQSSIDLPSEVPPVGSAQLINLVSNCPSFPEYLHIRTGQSVLATKVGLKIAKILPRNH